MSRVSRITVALAALASTLVLGPTHVVHAASTVNGGGSSFAKLEIDQWRAEVARKPYSLTINYLAQGSSFGRQGYIDGSLEFAASDIPFLPEELDALNRTNRKAFTYVPVSAGGLGIMYNLQDQTGTQITNLNLRRRDVCRLFTEPGLQWNDPSIAAVNPGVRLPASPVRPIVRADGSGTSYVLSQYCIAVAPDVWAAFVAAQQADPNATAAFKAGQPTSNWPQNWGGVASSVAADGVAAAVADSSGVGAVTYNEAGFAKQRGFPNASVENAAGQFTQPTEEAVSIALSYAEENGEADGTFHLNFDGPDPKAYFPSTYSYIIAQTTGFDAGKGETLARFLCYAVTKGQRVELTTALGYARLSAPLVEIARKGISKIPGAPAWDNCKVTSDAPPPAATTIPPTATTAAPAGGGGAGSGTGTGTGGGSGSGTGTTVAPAGGGTGTGAGTNAGAGAGTGTGGAATPGAAPAGSGSGSGSGSGTGASTATSIVVDPVTGSTVVVTVPDFSSALDPDGASGECLDPLTGLAADPATCQTFDESSSGVAAAGDGQVASGAVVPGAATALPAVPNPPIDIGSDGPDATKVIWWLLQGAALCGLGTALASVRKRAS